VRPLPSRLMANAAWPPRSAHSGASAVLALGSAARAMQCAAFRIRAAVRYLRRQHVAWAAALGSIRLLARSLSFSTARSRVSATILITARRCGRLASPSSGQVPVSGVRPRLRSARDECFHGDAGASPHLGLACARTRTSSPGRRAPDASLAMAKRAYAVPQPRQTEIVPSEHERAHCLALAYPARAGAWSRAGCRRVDEARSRCRCGTWTAGGCHA
jgi:hypothetical protein